MKTHQLQLRVPPDKVVTFKLPDDWPSGDLEVFLVANPTALRMIRTPTIPLGPVIFHEDPTAPLQESDWPEAHS
jgi:hypothetical protein